MKGKTIVRIRCLMFLKMDEDHKCGYIPNQIHFNWFTFVWIVIFCYKKVNKIFPDDTFEKRKTRSILVLGISFYRVLKFVLLQFDPRFLCVLWGWGAKLLTLCNTIIHYLSYSILSTISTKDRTNTLLKWSASIFMALKVNSSMLSIFKWKQIFLTLNQK